MPFDTISVIGLGYIGLPTAAVLASRKKRVVGVDINKSAVDTINKGEIHIIEPDLDIVVRAVVSEGYLRATTIAESADAFLIAVPTPFKGDHEPDLSYIESAAQAIAPVLKVGNLVILESTSPVGATEQLAEWLAASRPDLSFPQTHGEEADIHVAYCPERVLPGHVLRELVQNDRVIGGLTHKSSELAASLYKLFVHGDTVITNARTAEMCKLTENSFRDVNIAFANELSIICDKLKIDVWELIRLANRHPRVKILQPGPGVGGHCIAVDPWFVVNSAPEHAHLIRTAREVNDSKPEWVIKKIEQAANDFLSENPNIESSSIQISILGITFKPNIDDLRESPSLAIAKEIERLFPNQVSVVEPNIEHPPEGTNFHLININQALTESNLLVVLVDHDEFKNITPPLRNNLKIIDTRGVFPTHL